MSQSKLIEVSYYDPEAKTRLTTYADTIVVERSGQGNMIRAIRFGGYPEVTQAMAAAMYGGVTVEAEIGGETQCLQCAVKGYRRQMSHDGIYATATLMANDDVQVSDTQDEEHDQDEQDTMQPKKCYIFCPTGDRTYLFEELDRKTAAPLIPEFQDYVLDELIRRGDLRQMTVLSLRKRMDAWVLDLRPDDANVVQVLEEGLKTGQIKIPGAVPDAPDGFQDVDTVTSYLNTFGVTVADRIRDQFQPLFDPASEPLSEDVLAINDYIHEKAGYPLYDAQLAVAEAVKRQLDRRSVALICAECGSGKTKISSTALGALYGQWASQGRHKEKTFNLIMCPSHVTRKWVREIGETLPNTYGMVVRSITELNRLYAMYEQGDKNVYAVFSKERARDGYMRYPAVIWNQRERGFLCPDCMKPVQMELSDDGTKYLVNADQFFFQTENKKNHVCPNCGAALWAPVDPSRRLNWVKIGEYGWVYREQASAHLNHTKNETILEQLAEIVEHPNGHFPVKGAKRRYPLSTFIKKKMRGKINGFLCDELHEYNNASGQGDAMAELFGAAKQFVGMTATLINGYSSGIFHLLYRVVPHLMQKDDKPYQKPGVFDAEYGVVENTYELRDADYNSNRRTTKRKKKSHQLPGVSPLVFSRFLLEYTAFLSLSDMGKDLPDYEEIPVPLEMPQDVRTAYKTAENELQRVLRSDRQIAQKILSAYLGLLTVYPDQPYDQPTIVHPIDGAPIVVPEDRGSFERILPKEEKTMEIVREKIAHGERVLIYTSWTRTDSQQKLLKLLREDGIRTDVLLPKVPPEKREEWVEKRVNSGIQVLITNPKCVETGLDLNAFTTLIFYSMGYNLFTLRQASRRSWRINQAAPRVEVYLLYYTDTMQAKAMKLMASKLAVAGLIEGTFSEEGLVAMSDVKDMTSQMAKELMLGIKDNVEDIAASFKRMAILNPERKRVPTISLPESLPCETELTTMDTVSVETTVETAVKENRQALYEGLMEKSKEQQKKRSKKDVVDENQLSLFDVAA
jgi:superfamily II DNA or RNA helicase